MLTDSRTRRRATKTSSSRVGQGGLLGVVVSERNHSVPSVLIDGLLEILQSRAEQSRAAPFWRGEETL